MAKEPTMNEDTEQPQLGVHGVYIKNSLFEAAVSSTDKPKNQLETKIEMEVRSDVHDRGNDQFEAVLTLNCNAKLEGNLVWRAQVVQAGLYTLKNFSEDARKQVIHGYCMNQLYPYAGMNLTNLVVQAGFQAPQLMPIDFSRVYQEQMQQQQSEVKH